MKTSIQPKVANKARTTIPTEAQASLKVLMNHIYELHKGVRQMVLFTCNKKYGEQAVSRLESQGIPYILQPAGRQNLNVYFGRRECMEAIRLMAVDAEFMGNSVKANMTFTTTTEKMVDVQFIGYYE